MSNAQLGTVVSYLHDMASVHRYTQQTDKELLRAYLVEMDQRAFSALVKRHGPLVLGVCRRMLHHLQDAEDAFQATFLVLACQASSIRKEESLGSWLHGVAFRMCRNARRAATRRRKHERRANISQVSNPTLSVAWQEIQVLVDQETQHLPSIYREAFVLCCLENRSCAEAARSLGQKETTIRSRVARARRQLQKRLARRGVSLSAVLTMVAIGKNAEAARVSAALAQTTIHAALAYAQGRAVAGLVSAEVAALVQGAVKAMTYAKIKMATMLLLALGLGSAGFSFAKYQTPAESGDVLENRSGQNLQSAEIPNQPALDGTLKLAENESSPKARTQAPLVIFDDFHGKWLSNWQPLRYDPSHVSLTKFPGQLTITTQHGSIYGNVKAAGMAAKNLFLMDNPLGEGDFVLTTSISDFVPAAAYQQAGLICYDDDDHYIKWGYEFNNDANKGQKLCLIREAASIPTYDLAAPVPGLKRIWLRLTKRGGDYECAASADGSTFAVFGARPWGSGAPKKIGILAKNGPNENAPEIDARFDFFELRSVPPQITDADGDSTSW